MAHRIERTFMPQLPKPRRSTGNTPRQGNPNQGPRQPVRRPAAQIPTPRGHPTGTRVGRSTRAQSRLTVPIGKKSNTGLIVGLGIGGALLLVTVLAIALGSGNPTTNTYSYPSNDRGSSIPNLLGSSKLYRGKPVGHWARMGCNILDYDDMTRARVEAENALAALGAKESVPALIPWLSDADSGTRGAAASLIGKFGPQAKSAVSALQRAANDSDSHVREMATRALRHIRGS